MKKIKGTALLLSVVLLLNLLLPLTTYAEGTTEPYYSNDFSGSVNWPENEANWSVQDGVFKTTGLGGGAYNVPDDLTKYNNYQASFDIIPGVKSDNVTTSDIVFWFKLEKVGTWSRYEVVLREGKAIEIYRVPSDGTGGVNIGSVTVDLPTTTYNVKVKMKDAEIKVLINNKVVLTATDTNPLEKGGIGFRGDAGAYAVDNIILSPYPEETALSGRELYKNTFVSDFNGLDAEPTWSIVDEKLVGTGGSVWYVPIDLDQNTWNHYSVEYDCKYVGGTYNGGISLRVNDEKNTRYSIAIRSAGWNNNGVNKVEIYKIVNDASTVIGNCDNYIATPSINDNTQFKVKAVVNGEKVKVYIDNQLILSVKDEQAITSGGIGFTSFESTEMIIDNIVVTGMDLDTSNDDENNQMQEEEKKEEEKKEEEKKEESPILYTNSLTENYTGLSPAGPWTASASGLTLPINEACDIWSDIEGDDAWTNYTTTFKFKIVKGECNGGLHFRVSNNGATRYTLAIRSNSWSNNHPNKLELYKIVDNQATALADYTSYLSDVVINENQEYTAKVMVYEGSIRVFLNDKLVINVIDSSPLKAGGIGLTSARTELYYKDIKVEKLNENPATGDSSMFAMTTTLFVASLLMACGTVYYKKRKMNF